MADGVTTRIQRELTQVQRDVERMDTKFDQLGDKLRTDLFTELKNALQHFHEEVGSLKQHFNAEVSSLKQLLPGGMPAKGGDTNPEIVAMDSSEKSQKHADTSTAVGHTSGTNIPLVQEPDSNTSILDPLRINPRRNTLECPHFDGFDFLG